MKNLSAASLREKILVVVLVFSLSIGAYLMLRIKPMQTTLTVLQEQLDDSKKMLNNTRTLRPGTNEASSLRNDIAQLETTIDQEQQTLTGFKNSFIDLSRTDATPKMRKQITSLAERHQLRVLSIRASNLALDSLAGVKTKDNEEALARPLFDIKFSGGFFNTNQFILGLKSLPHAVVVTKLSISANKAAGDFSPTEVNTTLISTFTLAI